MGTFSRESLELLRSRIDLVEVLNPYLKLQRAGAAYKALCPFHDEKTPSFVIQRGDNHYHCFGCGAHGDAIQFLMTHLKMSFVEAVESLGQRFQVQLEEVQGDDRPKGPSKTLLKDALDHASRFYHFYLPPNVSALYLRAENPIAAPTASRIGMVIRSEKNSLPFENKPASSRIAFEIFSSRIALRNKCGDFGARPISNVRMKARSMPRL